MGSRNYQDLIAWQKAMDLAVAVYELTAPFPADERFGLTSQVRRAAASIAYTIAEGQGRFTVPDFKRFLSMAHGSTREVETQILLAVRLGFARQKKAEPVLDLSAEVGRLIRGLANSLGE
ncbi:MAG TPA: four helix bundle protein [Lacipirellula sp.]